MTDNDVFAEGFEAGGDDYKTRVWLFLTEFAAASAANGEMVPRDLPKHRFILELRDTIFDLVD